MKRENIPDTRSVGQPQRLQPWRAGVGLIVLVTEWGLTLLVVGDAARLPAALALHAAVVAALACLLAWTARHRGHEASRVDLFFLMVTGFLGPVGVTGCWMVLALQHYLAGRTTPFEVWYEAIFAGTESVSTQKLQRHVVNEERSADKGSSVAPFADVIANGSLEQKQSVVALISNDFQPAFAPALLAAMNDPEATMRVMAATAVARLESHFLRLSMSLEEAHAQNPDNAAAAARLGRHCDDYAHCGVLDHGRALAARTRALEMYRHCARLGGADADMMKATIRLLVRLGREREAVESFDPLIASGTATPELLAWYVECLYRLRRFTSLRLVCASLRAAEANAVTAVEELPTADRWQHAVALWAGSAQQLSEASR